MALHELAAAAGELLGDGDGDGSAAIVATPRPRRFAQPEQQPSAETGPGVIGALRSLLADEPVGVAQRTVDRIGDIGASLAEDGDEVRGVEARSVPAARRRGRPHLLPAGDTGGIPDQPAMPEFPLPRLPGINTIDDVLDRFQRIIDWAINANNGIGYFATVYKRATLAIRDAIRDGKFEDADRMKRFDVIFAGRYFEALNAYFHPDEYETPTHTWQWCFAGHEYDEPGEPVILLQHMLTAVNAHVNLDLGIAAATAGGDELESLERDFNLVNDLLAQEVDRFLDSLAELSPRIRVIRRLLPCEEVFIKQLLTIFRNLAWSFANQLAVRPNRRRADIDKHDSWAAMLGSDYLNTTDTTSRVIAWIAEEESRDVSRNIRVLDGVRPRR